MNKDDDCGCCRFYRSHNTQSGFCHRFPPQTVVLPQQTIQGPALLPVGDFPPTKPTNWCGEFQQMPQRLDA